MNKKIIFLGLVIGFMVVFYTKINSKVCENKGDITTCSDSSLSWQDGFELKKITQKETEDYCKNLKLGGFTDWRIPNIFDILTITVAAKDELYGYKEGFKNKQKGIFWAKSANTLDHAYFYVPSVRVLKTKAYMRCVRGQISDEYKANKK